MFRFEKNNFSKKWKELGYSFIKNDIIYVYLLFIYENPIILSLFETVTLKLANIYFGIKKKSPRKILPILNFFRSIFVIFWISFFYLWWWGKEGEGGG